MKSISPFGKNPGSTLTNVFDRARSNFPKGVRERTFTIDSSVTMNGLTQRRRAYLTIYR